MAVSIRIEGRTLWQLHMVLEKSFRKLMTLAKESPEVFEFPLRMEAKHGWTNNTGDHKRVMFRGRRGAVDIIEMAKTDKIEPYVDIESDLLFSCASYDVFLDTGSSCGESCEIGADD